MRYWPRISRREWRSAYSIASCASMILRSRLRAGLGEAEVADQLLGDRRAALDRPAGFEVLQRGAGDPLRVDAAVLVEALVLDRDGGALEALRDAVDRDRRPRFFGLDDAELAAVGRVDGRVAALVDRPAGGERGRLRGDVEHPVGDADRADREQRRDPERDEEQLAARASPVSLAATVALRHGGSVLGA